LLKSKLNIESGNKLGRDNPLIEEINLEISKNIDSDLMQKLSPQTKVDKKKPKNSYTATAIYAMSNANKSKNNNSDAPSFSFDTPKKAVKNDPIQITQQALIAKNEKAIQNIIKKAPTQEIKTRISLNKSNSIKNGNYQKTHAKQRSMDIDFECRKNESQLLELKNRKKELVNQAVVDISNKTEQNVIQPGPEKENTFWDKIFHFLNPFKCGHH